MRLRSLFDRGVSNAEFSAELDAHLQSHIDDNLREGMTVEEARRRALVTLGGVDMIKETYRDQRGIPVLEQWTRELRHAGGRLRRSSGFAGAAVLSLALAIGVNVAIFAVVERVVLNPLPYPRSNRLISLDFGMPSRDIAAGFNSMTPRTFFYYAQQTRTMESLAVSRTEDRTLTGTGAAERIRVARTTPSLAAVLKIAPEAGSWLPQDRTRNPAPVAVLSHGLWTRRFGADHSILGRTLTLDGVATTVVGVMPASFAYPDARVDVWVPEPFAAASDDSYSYNGVARVRDGVSLEAVRVEINQLTRSLHAIAPGNGYDAIISTALSLQDATVGGVAAALWILLASAGVVLLVACANVANLFLVRSETRQQEISVRRALGAGAGGIAGYFFAESLLLSSAGGALGLLAARYAVQLLVAFGPVGLPRLEEITLAPVHVLFAMVLAAIAGLVFGIVPLARLGRGGVPLTSGVRGATTANRRSHQARQTLMAAQVALALVLVAASGLLFRSFVRLRAIDPGFDPASTVTFQIGLPRASYPDRQHVVRAHDAILERLSTLPGVTAAGVINCVPLSGRGFCGGAPLFVEGEPLRRGGEAARPIVAIRPISSSALDALGMRIVRGRGITRADQDTNEPVAVVDETLARMAFPRQDPVGKRIRLGPHVQSQTWFTIVGLVKTTPRVSLTEPRPFPKMYVPIFATRDIWPAIDVMTYAVRTSTPPLALTSAARNAVHAIDSNLALAQVRTLQDHLDAAAAPRAFTMVLIVIAATTALLLGVVGIYGVMSYIVSQRTNEIGVRIALGAEPRAVTRMIVRQGGIVALGGIAAGLVAALAGGSVISSLLYGVTPHDPGVLVMTTFTLLAVALTACWLPARRAARVDPLVALRAE